MKNNNGNNNDTDMVQNYYKSALLVRLLMNCHEHTTFGILCCTGLDERGERSVSLKCLFVLMVKSDKQ